MFVWGTAPLHVCPVIDPPINEPPEKTGLLPLIPRPNVKLDGQAPANETLIGTFVVGPGKVLVTGPDNVPAPRLSELDATATDPLTLPLVTSTVVSEMVKVHRPPPTDVGAFIVQLPAIGYGVAR